MKKIILPILTIFYLFIYATPLLATPRTITITWTMPDPTNVQEFRIYYDSSETMANMELLDNHDTVQENISGTFTMSCYNVDMEDNTTYYFTVDAVMIDGSESFSALREAKFTTIPTTITTVQNFRVLTSDNNSLFSITGSENNGSPPVQGSGILALSPGVTHISDHNGYSNGAFNIHDTNYVNFPCYDGVNFNNNIGHIDFWYKKTGSPATYGRFFAHSSQDFSLQRHEIDTNINISWNNDQNFYVFSNVSNVFDGAWHHIILRWNLTTKTLQLNIDSNSYTANIPAIEWDLTQGNLYLGNRATADRNIGGAIDDLSIYDFY